MIRSLIFVLFVLLAAPASAQDAALADAAYRYLAGQGDNSHPSLRLYSSDLNDDEQPDGIVLLSGNTWCGSGGCKMIVFKGTEQGYVFISASTVVQEPIAISSEVSKGWHTLVVSSGGSGRVLLRFNGKGYPLNPSLQPKVSKQNSGQVQELSMVRSQ